MDEQRQGREKLLKLVNVNVSEFEVGTMTISIDLLCVHQCLRLFRQQSDTGTIDVTFYLRRLSDPDQSFQGIVADVVKCHNISNWESRLDTKHSAKLRRIRHYLCFHVQSRLSSCARSAKGATHGGANRPRHLVQFVG